MAAFQVLHVIIRHAAIQCVYPTFLRHLFDYDCSLRPDIQKEPPHSKCDIYWYGNESPKKRPDRLERLPSVGKYQLL